MTLATLLPEQRTKLRLIKNDEDSPLAQRLQTSLLTDRIEWMRIHVAEKVAYEEGKCNLRTYQRINNCYDIIDEISIVPMRRLYQQHGAKNGRIAEIELYDRTNIFIQKIDNSQKSLTACLVIEGSLTLEYKKRRMSVPIDLKKGNIFMWGPSVSVGFDDMQDARIAVYGII
ncbi:hypothetical protein HQ489_03045 [Candidatus Woesearchaeota archaeon]|nr:hypothetical protein [Candidatus Woesearchaeota archaeon]